MNLIIFNAFRAVNNGTLQSPAPLANEGLGQAPLPPAGAGAALDATRISIRIGAGM